MTLTPEQVQDVITRLTSIATNGLVPAATVSKYIPNPIPSAECILAPHVCLNIVEVKPSTKYKSQVYNMLDCHDSHGFINMAIERNYVPTIDNKETLTATVAERLFCSLVFILKCPSIRKEDDRRPLLSEEGEPLEGLELRTNRCFLSDQILAILVPAPLTHLVKKVFDKVSVVAAPMINGDLCLGSFSLGTTLWADFFPTKGSINVTKPDYIFALNSWVEKNNFYNQKFATHLTRFSTLEDFKNPFRLRTAKENAQMQQKMTRVLLRRMSESGKCQFRPTACHRYAIPADMLGIAKEHGAKEIPREEKQSSPFVLVEMQSQQLKDQKNGGIRQLLKMTRKACNKLERSQMDFLKPYPVAIEEELSRDGKKKYILTYPESLDAFISRVCLRWQSMDASARVIQNFFHTKIKDKTSEAHTTLVAGMS